MKKRVNIVVHGYGKVGKLVAMHSKADANFNVIATISRNDTRATHKSIKNVRLESVDVIIDFSTSSAFTSLFQYVARNYPKIRVVTGTSGWDQEESKITKAVESNKMYLLHGANFSVGTALFMKIVSYSTELFDSFENFDISLLDIHHRHKRDMPSGTAQKIAQNILDKSRTKKKVLYGLSENPIHDSELHVNCLRVGENKGFHEVTFDGADEVIKVSQQTRDRGVYAQGALLATKWLVGQKESGFYTFDSCLENLQTH